VGVADRCPHATRQLASVARVENTRALIVHIRHVREIGLGDLSRDEVWMPASESLDRLLVKEGRVLPSVVTAPAPTRGADRRRRRRRVIRLARGCCMSVAGTHLCEFQEVAFECESLTGIDRHHGCDTMRDDDDRKAAWMRLVDARAGI